MNSIKKKKLIYVNIDFNMNIIIVLYVLFWIKLRFKELFWIFWSNCIKYCWIIYGVGMLLLFFI